MALKKCPECGEMISSTSSQCIHCGYLLRTCPTCGEWMGPNDEKCPNCGHTETPPEPTLHLPHEKLKVNRGLIKYLLWSFLTLGIYSYYYIHAVSHEANLSCEGDGKKTRGVVFYFFITALTLGIYRWVWGYCVSERMAGTLRKANIQSPVSGASWFLWDFFGVLLFGIGPLIAQYQLIHALNEVNRLYSEHNQKEKASEEQKILNDVSDFYYDSKLHSISCVLTAVYVILILTASAGMIALVSYFGVVVNPNSTVWQIVNFLLYWIPVIASVCFLSIFFISATKNVDSSFSSDSPSKLLRLWGIGPIVARRAKKYLSGKDTKKHTEFCAKFLKELVNGKYPQFPKKSEFNRALILYIAGSYAVKNQNYLTTVTLLCLLNLVIFCIFSIVIPIFVPRDSLIWAILVMVAFIAWMFAVAFAFNHPAKKLYAWFEATSNQPERLPDEMASTQEQAEELTEEQTEEQTKEEE